MVLIVLVRWIPIDLSKATLYGKIILMILQIGLVGQVIQKTRKINHRLAIERGRYYMYKIPRNERYCEFCKWHQILQVEDEIHVLLTCLKHKAPRTDLFEVIKSNCSNFEKLHSKEQFNYLMNSSGPIVRAVAKCCHLVQNA